GAGSESRDVQREDSLTVGAESEPSEAWRQESVAESGASEAWPKASGAAFREDGPSEAGPSDDESTAASGYSPLGEEHGGPSSVGQADGPSDEHVGSASDVR